MKILFFSLSLLAASCASDRPSGKTPAEVLYKEAQELVEAERYILATEKLNEIKTQHPYSFYATPAELLTAEIQFKQESYVEAAASFLLFRDFHPKHEKIPWVVFMTGESYFKQLPDTIDRDLESGEEALKYYSELLEKYPSDPNVRKAKKRITAINGMLAAKDRYIADFYFKTESWEAARWWYRDIISRHSEGAPVPKHAMVRFVASSARTKKWAECLEYAEKFRPLVDKEGEAELRSLKKQCSKREIR